MTADPTGPVRAVIYDVDGTLYRLGPMRRGMAMRLAWSLACHPIRTRRAVKILRAYRHMQEALRDRPPAERTGPSDPDPQLAATADQLGLGVEAVAPVIEEWMRRRPLGLLARCRRGVVLEAIRALHAAGVPQGVYSDYPPADKLAALGVAECFDVRVWSAQREVGAYKPSPAGFLRAAELLGAAPAECLYVGDRPEVDGAGAAGAGMRYLDVSEIRSVEQMRELVGVEGVGVIRRP